MERVDLLCRNLTSPLPFALVAAGGSNQRFCWVVRANCQPVMGWQFFIADALRVVQIVLAVILDTSPCIRQSSTPSGVGLRCLCPHWGVRRGKVS
jgi:hypothetical protein